MVNLTDFKRKIWQRCPFQECNAALVTPTWSCLFWCTQVILSYLLGRIFKQILTSHFSTLTTFTFRFFYNAYFNKIQKQLSTNNKLANEKINDSEENNLKKLDTEIEEPSESKKTQWFAPAVTCIILKPDTKLSSNWNTQWKRTIIWGSK